MHFLEVVKKKMYDNSDMECIKKKKTVTITVIKRRKEKFLTIFCVPGCGQVLLT